MAVKFARVNLFVVLLQLAAFLIVPADLPFSQTAAVRPPGTPGVCPVRCCCPPEKHARGTCCCFSEDAHTKSGCSMRASHCGEDGRASDAPIVVKFEVTVPMLTIIPGQDLTRKPILLRIIDAFARFTEPPDPPPRLLVPA